MVSSRCVLPWPHRQDPSFPTPGMSCIFLWPFHTSLPHLLLPLPGEPAPFSAWWAVIHPSRCSSSCTSSPSFTAAHPLLHKPHCVSFLSPARTGGPHVMGLRQWLQLESSEDLLTPTSGTWAGRSLTAGAPQEASLSFSVFLCGKVV